MNYVNLLRTKVKFTLRQLPLPSINLIGTYTSLYTHCNYYDL